MNLKKIIFITPILLIFSAIPNIIDYQGKLVDTEGVAINDSLNMIFRLYNSEEDGVLLWQQEINDVPISKGLFSVELGGDAVFDTLSFTDTYWVEVEIDGDIIPTRGKLSSVAYAIHSSTVDSAIQSIRLQGGLNRRGNMVLLDGEGATLSEIGDTIFVKFSLSSDTNSGVCYTNWGQNTCASGFTRVVNGYIAIAGGAAGQSNTDYFGGSTIICSSINFSGSNASGIMRHWNISTKTGTSGYPVDNIRCAVCCK